VNKTWFITGSSRGFGRSWAQAALRRGDAPDETIAAVLAAADAADPPLRLLLGGLAYDLTQGAYARRQQTWAEWEAVTRQADADSNLKASQLPQW